MKELLKLFLDEFSSEKFPSLENLSKEFIEKNNLPPIIKKAETNKEILLYFNEGLVALESQGMSVEESNQFHFPIGSFGNTARKYDKRTYTLGGEIKNKKISLKTMIQYSQRYEFSKKGLPREFAPQPKKIGKSEKKIVRLDNEKYWFITDSI